MNQTRIEWGRYDILLAEGHVILSIGLAYFGRYGLSGELGESVGCSHLHLIVDLGGTNVQSTTEEEGEA